MLSLTSGQGRFAPARNLIWQASEYKTLPADRPAGNTFSLFTFISTAVATEKATEKAAATATATATTFAKADLSPFVFALIDLRQFPSSSRPFSFPALHNTTVRYDMMPFKIDAPRHGDVVDIGGSRMYDDVGDRLARTLKNPPGSANTKPTLPDELLYDDIGLPIWNEIIFTPEFYQTHDEIALFDAHGSDIVARAQPGVTLIDLGAGFVLSLNFL